MKIIKGVDPIFETEKYDVILIGTSVYDILTHGFQGKIGKKYPFVSEENHKQSYGDLRRLGNRVTIYKDDFPIISILYICGYPKKGLHSLDYDALKRCLETSAAEFKDKRIVTTIMGVNSFDGEGDRRKILRLMNKVFSDMDVDVYDYPQKSLHDEYKEKIKEFKETGVIDKKKRREILGSLYLI